MARCPKCSFPLTATEPGSRLALGCARCGGLWARDGAIDKLASGSGGSPPPASAARAPNDERTGLCPDGHGILLRARVEQQDEPAFYLERCAHCHGVWFDAGEWARVASSELRTHLDELWDPVARLEALRAKREARLTGDLRARLGDALHDQLVAVVEALASHPDRAMALAFVEERLARPSA